MKKSKVQKQSNNYNILQYFHINKNPRKIDNNVSQSNLTPDNKSITQEKILDLNEENIECSICLSIFVNPITVSCNHTFCESCLDKILEADSKCPLCRKKISKRDVKRNYTLQNYINVHKNIKSNKDSNSSLIKKKEDELLNFVLNYNFFENKCFKCRRPIKNNRSSCTYCYAKIIGQIVKCSNCPKRLPVFPNQLNKNNYCVDCYKRRKGKKGKCRMCNSNFYYMPLTSYSSTECEKCYLAAYGIKINCVDCGLEYNVMSDQAEWKNRCYECWLDS